jgi:hypothetical protein
MTYRLAPIRNMRLTINYAVPCVGRSARLTPTKKNEVSEGSDGRALGVRRLCSTSATETSQAIDGVAGGCGFVQSDRQEAPVARALAEHMLAHLLVERALRD